MYGNRIPKCLVIRKTLIILMAILGCYFCFGSLVKLYHLLSYLSFTCSFVIHPSEYILSWFFLATNIVVQAVSRLPIFDRERRRLSSPFAAFGVPIIDGTGVKRAKAVGLHRSADGLGLSGSINTATSTNGWFRGQLC
jgi:energy-converting hydrogenase Eha subunit A